MGTILVFMKDESLREEEVLVGEIFIEGYNKIHLTDYTSESNAANIEDTDADLIFCSKSGDRLTIQITRAVKSEKEEAKISKDLKEKGEAFIIGDVPDEDIIIRAIQKKCEKRYACSQGLILVVYTYRAVTMPRNFKLPENYLNNVKESFNEIWYVNMGKRSAIRIYP